MSAVIRLLLPAYPMLPNCDARVLMLWRCRKLSTPACWLERSLVHLLRSMHPKLASAPVHPCPLPTHVVRHVHRGLVVCQQLVRAVRVLWQRQVLVLWAGIGGDGEQPQVKSSSKPCMWAATRACRSLTTTMQTRGLGPVCLCSLPALLPPRTAPTCRSLPMELVSTVLKKLSMCASVVAALWRPRHASCVWSAGSSSVGSGHPGLSRRHHGLRVRHPDLAPRSNHGALTRCALPPLPSHRSSV